jgi:hypothetical protein
VWATPTNALYYRKFLIAERLAVRRLEHNGESLKMRQHKGKATLLQLLICRFTRANQPHLKTLAFFRISFLCFAQTRNPLKRADLNFKFINSNFGMKHIY